MNNLLELYDLTKDFADRHRMIAEFGVLGSEEEIGSPAGAAILAQENQACWLASQQGS